MYNIIRVLTKRVCMKDNYYRHINGVPYKMHCFIEMQFAAYFYTVVPYQVLIRLPIYKNSAISKSGAIFLSFCKIRDFGSPTKSHFYTYFNKDTHRTVLYFLVYDQELEKQKDFKNV